MDVADGAEPELRVVPARVHGRYWYRPANRTPSRGLLVGFHGYGENAASHLSQLIRLPAADRFDLASIQGLHRFYRRQGKEVVASWMTREDREQAIADNRAYVESVLESLAATVPVVLFGFSQGVAMAYRVAAGRRLAGLVALAGDVPPDVVAAGGRLPPLLIGRGRDDAWYDARALERDRTALAGMGAEVEVCLFAGGHEWSAEFRSAVARFLDRVAPE